MIKKIEFHKKQIEAVKYLKDDESEVIAYLGRANCGKSYLASVWLLTNVLCYPGSRGAMCRKTLKSIKSTTLNTFYKVCDQYGLKRNDDYKFNNIDSKITFKNGSEILLIELAYQPSDSECERFGGLELSFCLIDEISEISKDVYEVIYSRIRYLDEFNLHKKMLITGNPSDTWVKEYFYTRYIKNELPKEIKYVDTSGNYYNPFRGKDYEKTLSLLSESKRKKLEDGDWNYNTCSDQLFGYDKLEEVFSGLEYRNNKKYYISADVARFGKDNTVVCVWEDLKIIDIKQWNGVDIKETSNRIFELMQKYKIPRNQVVIDSDGVGGGVVDILKAVGFINNSKPKNNERYDMLKSQCYFTLSKLDWSIDMNISETIKSKISNELKSIRDKSDESKYKINSKDEQKLLLGHSPDFSDAIMMRMYFEFGESKLWLGVAN